MSSIDIFIYFLLEISFKWNLWKLLMKVKAKLHIEQPSVTKYLQDAFIKLTKALPFFDPDKRFPIFVRSHLYLQFDLLKAWLFCQVIKWKFYTSFLWFSFPFTASVSFLAPPWSFSIDRTKICFLYSSILKRCFFLYRQN